MLNGCATQFAHNSRGELSVARYPTDRGGHPLRAAYSHSAPVGKHLPAHLQAAASSPQSTFETGRF